jgi:hypothetical protein
MPATISVENVQRLRVAHDNFRDDMITVGVRIENVYSDDICYINGRVCFDGWVENWEKFLKTLGYDDSVLINHACMHWSFSAVCRWRFSHVNCTHFYFYLPMPYHCFTDVDIELFTETFGPYKDKFRNRAWLAMLSQFSNINFKKKFTNIFKQYGCWLSSLLSVDYELEKTK